MEVPAQMRPDIVAMVNWLHARRGILDRIEYAKHDTGGEWKGRIYVVVPDPEET